MNCQGIARQRGIYKRKVRSTMRPMHTALAGRTGASPWPTSTTSSPEDRPACRSDLGRGVHRRDGPATRPPTCRLFRSGISMRRLANRPTLCWCSIGEAPSVVSCQASRSLAHAGASIPEGGRTPPARRRRRAAASGPTACARDSPPWLRTGSGALSPGRCGGARTMFRNGKKVPPTAPGVRPSGAVARSAARRLGIPRARTIAPRFGARGPSCRV